VYNFCEIWSSNAQVYAVNTNTFCDNMAKIGIACQISQNNLDLSWLVTGLVVILVWMIIPIFVWPLPKGRCYGNQLNLGDVCRRRVERPLFFTLCSGVQQWIGRLSSCFQRFNSNNPATLCTNLVNFHPIISSYVVKMCNFWPQFDDDLSSSRGRFWNWLEDRNFWFQITNQQSFLYIL